MTIDFSQPEVTGNNTAGPHQAGGISLRLAMATRDLHRQAERSGIVKDLLHRTASISGYSLFLRNLLPAYRALEAAIERHGHIEEIAVFGATGLSRARAIEEDLAQIVGSDWESSLALLPAGRQYASRIDRIGDEYPDRLIGHAYTRYFGDLSGGSILKSLIGASLALPPAALRFYAFDELANADTYKETVRRRLDAIVIQPERISAIAEEAVEAFRLNISLSDEVSAAVAD